MISKDKERIILTLPKDIVNEINYYASEYSCTKSNIVKSILQRYFESSFCFSEPYGDSDDTTVLSITDRTDTIVYLSQYGTYDLACSHAVKYFDYDYYIWHFYKIQRYCDGNIVLVEFCSCQGGQNDN